MESIANRLPEAFSLGLGSFSFQTIRREFIKTRHDLRDKRRDISPLGKRHVVIGGFGELSCEHVDTGVMRGIEDGQ